MTDSVSAGFFYWVLAKRVRQMEAEDGRVQQPEVECRAGSVRLGFRCDGAAAADDRHVPPAHLSRWQAQTCPNLRRWRRPLDRPTPHPPTPPSDLPLLPPPPFFSAHPLHLRHLAEHPKVANARILVCRKCAILCNGNRSPVGWPCASIPAAFSAQILETLRFIRRFRPRIGVGGVQLDYRRNSVIIQHYPDSFQSKPTSPCPGISTQIER